MASCSLVEAGAVAKPEVLTVPDPVVVPVVAAAVLLEVGRVLVTTLAPVLYAPIVARPVADVETELIGPVIR
jgi:hypothetical protein